MLRTKRQARRRRKEGIHRVIPVIVGGSEGSKLLEAMGSERRLFCIKGTETRKDVYKLLDTWAFPFFLLLSKPVTLQMTMLQERKVTIKADQAALLHLYQQQGQRCP